MQPACSGQAGEKAESRRDTSPPKARVLQNMKSGVVKGEEGVLCRLYPLDPSPDGRIIVHIRLKMPDARHPMEITNKRIHRYAK